MATKKPPAKQEPLLNAVARKIGHAAGTLTKATQELTENLSALPETVSTRMHQMAKVGTLAERSRTRARGPKKGIRRARPARKAKGATGAETRRRQRSKSSRSNRKSSTRQQ